MKERSAVDHLAAWLEENPILTPRHTREELARIAAGPNAPRLRSRNLPETKPEPLQLPTKLTAEEAQALDEFVRNLLVELKAKALASPGQRIWFGENPFWLWTDRNFYRRETDTWADDTWWLELARSAPEHDGAAVILLTQGHRDPVPALLERMRSCDDWDNELMNEHLVWPLLDELPWPIDADWPNHSLNQGSPPPALARHKAMRVRTILASAEKETEETERLARRVGSLAYLAQLDPASAAIWLSESERMRLREIALEWASQEENESLLLDTDALRAAAEHGWTEINGRLQENPTYWRAQENLMKALGRASVEGTKALLLSAISPDDVARNLAAQALRAQSTDDHTGRIATLGATQKFPVAAMPRLEEHFRNRDLKDKFAAAIAWWRCRRLSLGKGA